MSDERGKLFRVDFDFCMYVVAEDEFAAELVATDHVADQIDSADCFVQEVKRGQPVMGDWQHSYPWGGDSDVPCGKWWDAIPLSEAEQEEAGQVSAFPTP